MEVLAQQTEEKTRQYKCPQTINVQDGDFSKQYCLPEKMGVVTQMSCQMDGENRHVTMYYVHIEVKGHTTITFKGRS